jgi:hypothetical protein
MEDCSSHDLPGIAQRATYVGSAEHKTTKSFAGPPSPRNDATKCDPSLASQQEEVTLWLRSAIQRGNVSEFSGDFPKYVWIEVEGQLYEGRLVNHIQGQYKGYPCFPHEKPRGYHED